MKAHFLETGSTLNVLILFGERERDVSWEVGKRPVRWEPWCQAVSKISSLHHIGSLIVTNHGGTDWAQQGSRKIDNFSQASKIHERGGGPVTPLLCCSTAQSLPWRAKISGVIFFSWEWNTFGLLMHGSHFRRILSEGPRARLKPRVVN